jgi:uncharacterized protein YbjQ (UPF0145 family)
VSASGSAVVVSMTREVEGHSVKAYLGIVTGQAVARLSHAKWQRKCNNTGARVHAARDQAVKSMEMQAVELGAEAVIGVAIDCSSVRRPGGGVLIIAVASGTAVLLDPEDHSTVSS